MLGEPYKSNIHFYHYFMHASHVRAVDHASRRVPGEVNQERDRVRVRRRQTGVNRPTQGDRKPADVQLVPRPHARRVCGVPGVYQLSVRVVGDELEGHVAEPQHRLAASHASPVAYAAFEQGGDRVDRVTVPRVAVATDARLQARVLVTVRGHQLAQPCRDRVFTTLSRVPSGWVKPQIQMTYFGWHTPFGHVRRVVMRMAAAVSSNAAAVFGTTTSIVWITN
jgi:hypothetical protein